MWRHRVLRHGGEKWGKTISQGLRGLEKKFGLWPSGNGRLWEVFEEVRELIKCAFRKIKMFLHKQILKIFQNLKLPTIYAKERDTQDCVN